MTKWDKEKVRETWEANGRDFEKTRSALGMSRASLFRHLAVIRKRTKGLHGAAPSQDADANQQTPPRTRLLKGVGRSWNLYLPNDLAWIRQRLEARAKKERRSVGELALMILEEHLKREDAEQKPSPRPLEEPAWLNEPIPGKPGQE